ncbi:MAG: hypothetical protein A3D87_01260 [Omnitrophica WOR_2 bacterium RIFCSPHIGHO2_02_FULL_50_17]|nr:MAG: hypothetical protein A3D87_01260 [Omnitrophica WOR_2 bacterium RIFCSPHIGHO2_02_FULL_50_17]
MPKYFQKSLLGLALIFPVMTTQGCVPLVVGAAAGGGVVAYAKGDLHKNFDNSVSDLHKASLAAVKNIKASVYLDKIGRHSAKIKFEFDDKEKGEIVIKALTERTATLKIRVGLLGDEIRSQMVLNALQKQL